MLATLALAALALAVLMGFSSGDVPRADEWDTPGGYLLAHAQGASTFAHLFHQHNESRVIFAQLLAGFVAEHWGWNQHVFHALNWLLLVLTAYLFVRLVARTWPAGQRAPWAVALILCVAVAVVFTPVQWRNLLSSGQIITISIPCLLLIGLSVNLATHLSPWLRHASALGCALLASFSYVNGLMLWFLLWPLPFVLLEPGRARVRAGEIAATVLYFLAAFGTIAAFFADYHSIPGHPSLRSGLLAPHRALLFAATLLCGPIFPERVDIWFLEGRPLPFLLSGGLAVLTGMLALALLARSRRELWQRAWVARAFPFLVLIAYSAASATAIGLARAGLGRFGNVSRYSTIAIPAFLGLAGVVGSLDLGRRPEHARRVLRPLALVFALATAVAAWIGGIECLLDRAAARQARLSLAVRRLCPDDPLLINVFPRTQQLVESADRLEELGLLPPLPAYVWAIAADPPSRGELTYRLSSGEALGLRSLQGRLAPASGLEADDVLLLWDREAGRPTTAFLAPAGMNYPGKDAGAFELRFDAAGRAGLDLAKHELRLARPRTREVWRLSPEATIRSL
jgi:hypothetical protein